MSKKVISLIITILGLIMPTSMYSQQYECEDTCQHIHGIDVSHYQGDIFWETVGANPKMAYVYLKASEGGNNKDRKYEQNVRLAHQHGLKVGAYHFYRPRVPQEEQLANMYEQVKPNEQDLLPMIDIEVNAGLSAEELCDSLFKFLELVEEAYKQRPLIYTGTNFYNRHFAGKLDRYLIMIAQYSTREPKLSDERDITMWQYTEKGVQKGIKGYIDKSRFMGHHQLREIRFRHRKGEMAQWKRRTAKPEPTPENTEQQQPVNN